MRSVSRLGTHSALGLAGLVLWACNGIVGIKELHEGPNPNAGGAAGNAGAAGALAKGGGVSTSSGGTQASAGGAATTAGRGGSSPNSGGSLGLGGAGVLDAGAGGAEGGSGGDVGSGGTAPGSGGAKAGSGGAATGSGGTATGSGGKANTGGSSSGGASTGTGGASGGPGTVSGTLIDLWGHPLPNVAITIGTVSAVTNASGKFSVANVPAQYDVTASLHPDIGGGTGNYAWVYQGLTRRDPTLQVYRGLADQSADPTIKPTGASDTNKNAFAWGCPDGSHNLRFGAGAAGTTPLGALSWFGPTQTVGAYHVLAFKQDTNGYPTEYSTYLTAPLTVTADTPVTIPLTFTNTLQTTGSIGGTVTSVTSTGRSNYLFARFTDNATIPIANVTASTAAFSFLAPQITGASFTVAASEGTEDFYGPYAIAHKMAAVGATNVALSIPAPPTQIAPANNRADVNGTTLFSWASATDTVYVVHIESNPHYSGMYIVTTAKSLKLPDVGGAFFLNKNELHWWQVEVHGDYTSVDQVARPGGFLDSFGRSRTEPDFYRAQDAGFVAVSAATGFTTAP
jgi:hypothetical protein